MVNLSKDRGLDPVEMRAAYGEALVDAGRENPMVVSIDCDLSASMGTAVFARAFPQRQFNCGIAEANGCGLSAGLSVTGFIPFFHSFTAFSSRRVYDQTFVSCAYAGLNAKIIGGDAGVTAATNGGTHMSFEDIGLMRNIPGVRVIEPTDNVMLKSLIPQMVSHYGVEYLRMPRKNVRSIYEEGSSFTIGKAVVLREGQDVTIIASGVTVYEALEAADALKAQGIDARVVDMFTIKPLDARCVIESARKTGAIVTAENHSVINGLGAAVAEVLGENLPVPLERVGVRDMFGEVGSQEYLMERFELTATTIAEKAKKAVARKA
jgi:transketolase